MVLPDGLDPRFFSEKPGDPTKVIFKLKITDEPTEFTIEMAMGIQAGIKTQKTPQVEIVDMACDELFPMDPFYPGPDQEEGGACDSKGCDVCEKARLQAHQVQRTHASRGGGRHCV